jgi:hypothetical protein
MLLKTSNYVGVVGREHRFLFLGKSVHVHTRIGVHDKTRITVHDERE